MKTVTEYLEFIRKCYGECYPDRPLSYINAAQMKDGAVLEDTGICYRVAFWACSFLVMNMDKNIRFVVRSYNAPNGDGFEDTVVHAVLEHNGKFYDTDDFSGVSSFDALQFNARNPGQYLCVDEDDAVMFHVQYEDDRETPFAKYVHGAIIDFVLGNK